MEIDISSEHIEQRKQEILSIILKEIGLKPDLLERQKNKRFPSICKVTEEHCGYYKETWYYDNGTDEGERIVTFNVSGLEFAFY